MRGYRFHITLALAVLGSAASAEVKVEQITYRGWQGAYRMTNGTVDLVVVPQIGRIMRYGYVSWSNVLWENPALAGKMAPPAAKRKDWVNFGGDKLWPAPQSKWNWPPDPLLDGTQQKAEVLPDNSLRLTSPVSKKSGVRFVRTITMDPAGTGVHIRSMMENSSDHDVEWSLWEITQIRVPQAAVLPSSTTGRNPKGYYIFKTSPPAPGTVSLAGDEVRFRWHPTNSGKIGSDSPSGWVAADFRGFRFTIRAAHPDGEYPDDGCAEEIWSNPNPLPYMELERLSPITLLRMGDKLTMTTHWSLTRTKR